MYLLFPGFLIPFIYLPDVALANGYSREQAVMLVSIIGLVNTAGRVLCGWICDKSWADALKIYNCALIVGGVATAVCTWLQYYPLLAVYAGLFGLCVGKLGSLSMAYHPPSIFSSA